MGHYVRDSAPPIYTTLRLAGRQSFRDPIGEGLRVTGDLDCKVPTLKASGFAPRFGCQTTQDQSVGFA